MDFYKTIENIRGVTMDAYYGIYDGFCLCIYDSKYPSLFKTTPPIIEGRERFFEKINQEEFNKILLECLIKMRVPQLLGEKAIL